MAMIFGGITTWRKFSRGERFCSLTETWAVFPTCGWFCDLMPLGTRAPRKCWFSSEFLWISIIFVHFRVKIMPIHKFARNKNQCFRFQRGNPSTAKKGYLLNRYQLHSEKLGTIQMNYPRHLRDKQFSIFLVHELIHVDGDNQTVSLTPTVKLGGETTPFWRMIQRLSAQTWGQHQKTRPPSSCFTLQLHFR